MNDKECTRAEYGIDAKLNTHSKSKEVKVCDVTDMKGVIEILRCQYNTDDAIISIMKTEQDYCKRFFTDDVDLEVVLKQFD